jgi:hypothetical protein
MASSINNSDAVIALTGSQKKVDAASDNLDVGPDIGVDQTVNQTSIDNAPSADVPLLLDADDNQNNLTYSKEYEAVLQIKQVSNNITQY